MRKLILLFAGILSLNTFAASAQKIQKAPTDTLITVSDGTQLYISIKGEGPPCLYIHGGPGVGSYWMEKLYGEQLEEYFTMIYLDQRGSGRSSSPETGNYSPERMVKDFEEIRKALNIDSWITFSHSFGGIMQMEYADHHPEFIKGMMLVAATLDLGESVDGMVKYALQVLEIPANKRAAYFDKKIPLLKRVGPLFNQMREKGIFWKVHYGNAKNYEIMDSVMAEVPNPNYDFSGKAMEMKAYYFNYKPLTAQMKMPVLLFYGENDHSVGPTHYQDFQFPNADLVTWSGGHVPFMEGKDALEQAIKTWLGSHDF